MRGIELKTLRKKLGLSVADAARQIEVHPRSWTRWESEERKIPKPIEKLFKLLNGIKR